MNDERIEELLEFAEPFTRERYDADFARVVARLCEKHGVPTLAEVHEIVREHRYQHDAEDIEDDYIGLLAFARVTGWPMKWCATGRNAFQCDKCGGNFCIACKSLIDRRDGRAVGLKTIGAWFCDAVECMQAEAELYGITADQVKLQHARRHADDH